MTLSFTVYGVAQPKGNMRAIHLKGMKFPIVTDSNRSAKSWSQLVAEGASRALGDLPEAERLVLVGAVRLSVAFYLPRPKKYQRRGVPAAHLKAPDIDKLLRGVLDALTSVAWQDDSQVVELVAAKFYAETDEPPHVNIRIASTAGTRAFVVPAAPASLFDGYPGIDAMSGDESRA
jgi:Holliday junction resolvase RusA-like endonuclease